MIVNAYNIYQYAVALKNSGITQESIDVLERQILLLIFGKDGARRLIMYINENKQEIPDVPNPETPAYDFGGIPVEKNPIYSYGEISELIYGDKILYSGLLPLLSILIALNFESKNRYMIARQNVVKQPVNSRVSTRRDENEVTQEMAFEAHNILFALDDYLKQEGKNPLKLEVKRTVSPTKDTTNVSGKMGMNIGLFGGMYGGWY